MLQRLRNIAFEPPERTLHPLVAPFNCLLVDILDGIDRRNSRDKIEDVHKHMATDGPLISAIVFTKLAVKNISTLAHCCRS